MRLVVAALALILGSAGAVAQPVSTAPLGAREVLLETSAEGVARTPADRVSLMVTLRASAATAAVARAALARNEARLVAAARSAGVGPEDLDEYHATGPFGMVGNEAMLRGAAQPVEGEKTALKILEVRVRDPARLDSVRAALEAAGGEVGDPVYSLVDDSAARQAARDEAVAHARAEAEAYARSLNMRVSRIVRLSSRPSADTSSIDMMQAVFQRMMGRGGSPSPVIETSLRVAADFALAPQ